MYIFTNFFYRILVKYSPKRTKLHPFFLGEHAPEPPSKYPHFSQKNLNPPPRNKILDTLLYIDLE